MSADIVNLNRFRKAKARTEKEREAAQNRLTYGRPKAEREAEAAERTLKDRTLEQHRLEPEPPDANKLDLDPGTVS